MLRQLGLFHRHLRQQRLREGRHRPALEHLHLPGHSLDGEMRVGVAVPKGAQLRSLGGEVPQGGRELRRAIDRSNGGERVDGQPRIRHLREQLPNRRPVPAHLLQVDLGLEVAAQRRIVRKLETRCHGRGAFRDELHGLP